MKLVENHGGYWLHICTAPGNIERVWGKLDAPPIVMERYHYGSGIVTVFSGIPSRGYCNEPQRAVYTTCWGNESFIYQNSTSVAPAKQYYLTRGGMWSRPMLLPMLCTCIRICVYESFCFLIRETVGYHKRRTLLLCIALLVNFFRVASTAQTTSALVSVFLVLSLILPLAALVCMFGLLGYSRYSPE